MYPVPRCDVVVNLRHFVSRSTTNPIMHAPFLKSSEVFVAAGNRRFVIVGIVVVSREKMAGCRSWNGWNF